MQTKHSVMMDASEIKNNSKKPLCIFLEKKLKKKIYIKDFFLILTEKKIIFDPPKPKSCSTTAPRIIYLLELEKRVLAFSEQVVLS
jgi:hypothetical protein